MDVLNAIERAKAIAAKLAKEQAQGSTNKRSFHDEGESQPPPEKKRFGLGHSEPQGTPGMIHSTMDIPSNKVGLVIGKGGETIMSIQSQSRAKVFLAADPSTGDRPTKTLNISGSQAEVDLAKKLITDVLSGSGGGMPLPGAHSETLRIANDKVGLVIGKGGETIKGLQQQLGIRIQIEQPTGGPEREIIISGSLKGIEAAKASIFEKIGMNNNMNAPSGFVNPYQQAHQQPPAMEEYTLEDYKKYYDWYMISTGGKPYYNVLGQSQEMSLEVEEVEDIVEEDQEDELPPGMDAPPGLEPPPGLSAPLIFGAPPGLAAPPGL